MALSIVRKEISNLGIKNLSRPYWYFYILELDSKPCVKLGKSCVNLEKRIINYLDKEHPTQAKNWDSFKLISVVEFEDKEYISPFEMFIKKCVKKYPLHKDQHSNIEQYNLMKVWPKVKQMILQKKFPFSSDFYCVNEPDKVINDFLKNYKEKNKDKNKTLEFDYKNIKERDILDKINSMTYSDYKKIHQIGKMLAERLTENKPFTNLSQIKDISGIAQKRYDYIISHVTGLLESSLVTILTIF